MIPLIFNGWACPISLFKMKNPYLCQKNILSKIQPFDKVFHVVGFSMGCYPALNFALKHPEKTYKISLIAFRNEYPKEEIDSMISNLQKNPKITLSFFYKQSLPNKEDWSLFKKIYLEQCLLQFTPPILIEELKYATRHTNQGLLQKIRKPIDFFHAKNDIIAPLKELNNYIQKKDTLHVNNWGHLPFLNKNFDWSLIL